MDEHSDEETFSSKSAEWEPSKESISHDYLKVEPEEERVNSSPEVISGPEEDELTSLPTGPPPPLEQTHHQTPPPLTSDEVSSKDEFTSSYQPSGIEDMPLFQSPPSRPSPKKQADMIQAEGYLKFLNFLHPAILSILYWKDFKLSGLTLVMIKVILFTLCLNTVLHTIVLLLLAALLVSLLFIVTKIAIDSFYNKQIGNPFQAYLKNDLCFLNEDVAIKLTRRAVKVINCKVNSLAKIVFFDNWLQSLKFMAVLFLMSYVTNYFDVMTTLVLGVVLLFGIPPLYTRYRSPIDDTIEKSVSQFGLVYSKVHARLPFLPKLKDD